MHKHYFLTFPAAFQLTTILRFPGNQNIYVIWYPNLLLKSYIQWAAVWLYNPHQIDGLVQDCGISIANALNHRNTARVHDRCDDYKHIFFIRRSQQKQICDYFFLFNHHLSKCHFIFALLELHGIIFLPHDSCAWHNALLLVTTATTSTPDQTSPAIINRSGPRF